MSHPIITVENLAKRYTLRHEVARGLLRDQLASMFSAPARWLRRAPGARPATREEFWALRGINFSINRGDVVGIIGRNGAGKSTLLKILSRITEPTAGCVTLRGRVASLLEVGTGFHPELTGRENVFLNGAILGMTRAEIRRKFDEIVAFAEVDRFIDTPVKHYSSGMYVRLAFAVAAHLEPEILIVDEVLAVGDAAFQKKCLGKMHDVSTKQGQTVLFVSHNLKAVEHFCTRGLLLEHGGLSLDDTAHAAVTEYLKRGATQPGGGAGRKLNDELHLISLVLTPGTVRARDPLEFLLEFSAQRDCQIHDLHLFIYNSFDERVAIVDLRDPARPGGSRPLVAGQRLKFSGRITRIAFVEGHYRVGFYLRTSLNFQDHYDLADLYVTAPSASAGLMPYAPEYQGTTLLDYDFTAGNF